MPDSTATLLDFARLRQRALATKALLALRAHKCNFGNCSSNSACVAPYTYQCRSPFTGPDCATLLVSAQYKTEAAGADGDNPAIWVAPDASKTKSRNIATTKSEDNP